MSGPECLSSWIIYPADPGHATPYSLEKPSEKGQQWNAKHGRPASHRQGKRSPVRRAINRGLQ